MQIFITKINTQESDFVAVFVPKIPPSNVCSEANPSLNPRGGVSRVALGNPRLCEIMCLIVYGDNKRQVPQRETTRNLNLLGKLRHSLLI